MARCYVGVDGCPAGWLAVTRGPTGLLYGRVFERIAELADEFKQAERIFIDVPIGLPWADSPVRPCDRLARVILGKPRHSSVFPIPCREALAVHDLKEAQRINLRQIGRSIGRQTWKIRPKLGDMDRFLLDCRGNRQAIIREVHPEVCFWALADRMAMAHSKKTRDGRLERICAIERYEPGVRYLLDQVAHNHLWGVQVDDVKIGRAH